MRGAASAHRLRLAQGCANESRRASAHLSSKRGKALQELFRSPSQALHSSRTLSRNVVPAVVLDAGRLVYGLAAPR